MIDNVNFEIDAERWTKALSVLTGSDYKKIAKKAVASAGRILVYETKKEFRKVTSRAKSKRTNAANSWHLKKKNGIIVGVRSLEEGIRSKTHMEGAIEHIFSKVNIMSDHRLRWFEAGTKERETSVSHADKSSERIKVKYKNKKGYITYKWKYSERVYKTNVKKKVGKMTATWFFEKARNASEKKAQQKIEEVLERELSLLYYKNN